MLRCGFRLTLAHDRLLCVHVLVLCPNPVSYNLTYKMGTIRVAVKERARAGVDNKRLVLLGIADERRQLCAGVVWRTADIPSATPSHRFPPSCSAAQASAARTAASR